MRFQIEGDTVRISGVKGLSAEDATAFRDHARAVMLEPQRHFEIDLSETEFLDSCGLGALIALHKTACNRKGVLRLLNPQPQVRQILELTRLHRVFEISP